MIGLNAGLLGAARTSRRGAAVGVWTPNEQVIYQRQNTWIGDSNFNSVSLLLHMNGSNGSTTFADSSLNSLAVTAAGNAQISTAQSRFGGASAYFDGIGDSLTIAHNQVLNLSSGNFTIEFWFYHISRASSQVILDKDGVSGTSYPSYACLIDTSGNCNFRLGNGAGTNPTATFYAVGVIPLLTWVHIALVKSGTTITTYLDGVQGSTATQGVAITDGGKALNFGYTTGVSPVLSGYIDELRITKGVARYTGAFTPPAAPFPDA